MIDQASVFADRFRNNRQALQAAVLGQNSGVDPYTALRALQLLKESDSMQVAQQGQQPTEAPSLLQEAMQPPQMPMGMAVPGQQMSQAPQQSGGLEAMPVSEQDFADGGIIAFAEGAPIPGPEDVKERWQDMKRRPDETPTEFLRRVEAAKQEDFQAQGPAKFKQSLEEALKENKRNMRQGMGAALAKLVPGLEVRPEGMEREDLAAASAPASASKQDPFVPTGSIHSDAMHKRRRAAAAAERELLIEDEQAPPPDEQQDTSPARGLGAMPQSQAMTDALATQSDARANLGAISYNPPDAVKPQTATQRFEGAKDQLDNVKEYMGEDKYSAEARKIIEERTADLTDPDRNKFDKALAWFKGAAAMQKGRGLESIANAAAEVAGGHSVIKKEDRKEKNAIRDMNLNLTKAEQAREDGQKSTAMNWQDKAQADKVAAAEAAAKRYEAGLRIETAVKSALFESANKNVSSLRTDETQNRSIDSTAETARQRIESDEKTRAQTAAGQADYRNNTAYQAALDYLRKTEADVALAKAKDEPLQKVISNIARAERKAADGNLDQKGLAKLAALKAELKVMESKYAGRLQQAQDGFNVISERVRGAAGIGTGGGAPTTDYTAKPIDKATYDSLPKGTKFKDPKGQIRIK